MSARRIAAVLLLAACGERDRTVDAAEVLPPPDTLAPGTADAAAGAVTIAVTLGGVAVPGAPVYFQNADSSVVAAVLTDGNGTAGATLAAGGFVTVIEPAIAGAGRTNLSTFAAVEPGDALRLDLQPSTPETIHQFTITLTADTAPGIFGHHLVAPCGIHLLTPGIANPVRLTGCPAVIDFMVVSAGDGLENIIGSHYHLGQNINGTTLDLTGAAYDRPSATSFQYSAIPPAVSFVGMNNSLVTPMGTILDRGVGSAPSAGAANLSLTLPPTQNTTSFTSTLIVTAPEDPGEQLIFEWAPSGGGYSLAVDSVLLPAFTDRGGYDQGARRVTWNETGGALQPDVVRVSIGGYRDDIPEGRAWQWRLVAPRTGTSVAYPTLPNDGFDFNPTAGDTITIRELSTAKLPAGYVRSVREQGFADFKRLVAGASGRLVQQTLQDPPGIDDPPARRAQRRPLRGRLPGAGARP
jgi:hypothetical protein